MITLSLSNLSTPFPPGPIPNIQPLLLAARCHPFESIIGAACLRLVVRFVILLLPIEMSHVYYRGVKSVQMDSFSSSDLLFWWLEKKNSIQMMVKTWWIYFA